MGALTVYNVKTDYNGSIQNALNAAATTGGIVYLPYGTYTITSGLTLSGASTSGSGSDIHFSPMRRIKILGDHAIIKATAAMTNMLTINSVNYFLEIENVVFDGGSPAKYATSGLAINSGNMHIKVEHCAFWHLTKGISCENVGVIEILYSVFKCAYGIYGGVGASGYGGIGDSFIAHNDFYPNNEGIHLEGSGNGNNSIFRNIFSRDQATGIVGININSTSTSDPIRDIKISENEFYGCDTAIKVVGYNATYPAYGIIITENHYTPASVVGIKCTLVDATYMTASIINNNRLGTPSIANDNYDSMRAVYLKNCTGINVQNNIIGGASSEAVRIENGTGMMVSGNSCFNAGLRTVGDAYINLYNTNDSVVFNNRCENFSGISGATIGVALTGASAGCRVTHNFTKNVSAAAYNGSSGSNNVLVDNYNNA